MGTSASGRTITLALNINRRLQISCARLRATAVLFVAAVTVVAPSSAYAQHRASAHEAKVVRTIYAQYIKGQVMSPPIADPLNVEVLHPICRSSVRPNYLKAGVFSLYRDLAGRIQLQAEAQVYFRLMGDRARVIGFVGGDRTDASIRLPIRVREDLRGRGRHGHRGPCRFSPKEALRLVRTNRLPLIVPDTRPVSH